MLPILYQNPNLTIYSYPLLMGLGWGIAYQIFNDLFPKTYSKIHFQLLFWGLFFSAWMGAKALFLLTVSGDVYDSAYSALSFWMGGGFVFYGGLITSVGFLFLFHKFVKKVTAELLWSLLPALTFGHSIGRIGCFLAGCCFGDVTTFFWGVLQHGHVRHPTQLLESLFLIFVGIYLLKSKNDKTQLIIHYLVGYGCFRFLLEFLRGDSIRGGIMGLSTSQIVSSILILSALILCKKSKISVG